MDYSKNQYPTFEEAVKAISKQNDDSDPASRSQELKKTAKDDTNNMIL